MENSNAFSAPGRWYRANLHTHTTGSDGKRTPAEAVEWYRSHGYDIVALTDHHTLTPVEELCTADFLVLPGIEVHPGANELGEPYHIVAAGVRHSHVCTRETPVQAAIDELRADGGVVWIGHPYWVGLTVGEMLKLHGTIGIEVSNSTCQHMGKGTSAVHWDDLLARGQRPWGLAVDDAHWGRADYGRGWVMIKAETLAPEAILEALRQGRFYASTGPEIYDVQVSSEEIHVRCSPCVSVAAVSLAGSGRWVEVEDEETRSGVTPGGRNPGGETLGGGTPPLLREVTLPRKHQKQYVRIEVTDARGRMAWAQPVLL